MAPGALGPQGRVVAVDASGEMCERAWQKGLGLENIVEVHQGDGAALALPAESFDAVICSSGIYTFPDIPATLTEWRRVLKSGGRVAFSTLGAGSDRLYRELLQRYGIPLPAVLPTQRVDSLMLSSPKARGAPKGRYKGQDASGQFRYTRIWAKRNGRWQAVAAQATMIPR